MTVLTALFPAVLLLGVSLAQGIFVSGILPIIEQAAPTQAAWIYSLYFAGLLTGQVLLVRFGRLSTGRAAYPFYVALFGAAILIMGFGLHLGPTSLLAGRALEGLAAGLALPLGFAYVTQLQAFGDIRRRISIFNSLFALGFVAGPPAIAAWLHWQPPGAILSLAGAGFIGLALCLALAFPKPPASPAPDAAGLGASGWFDGFYGLFLAKSFYGFFLPFMAAHLIVALRPLSIGQAMLGFAGLFVIGQVLATLLTRKVPVDHLRVYLPVMLALTLTAIWAGASPLWMGFAALIHSGLLFIGYLGAALKPTSAREFARLNALSDPGMLVGALLAGFGPAGMLGVAALGLVPLVRALRSPPNLFRAEHYFPFVGPIGLPKVLAKHKDPLKAPRDWPEEAVAALRFEHRAEFQAPSRTLSLAFCGDWAPMPESFGLSERLRSLILAHDLRFVNLEGGRTTTRQDTQLGKWLFDLPADHYDRVMVPESEAPTFNVVSCINNHALDAGAEALDATLRNVGATPGVTAVASDLTVIAVDGLRVGVFARTFGSNMLWRRNPALKALKPEAIVNDARVREALLAEIAAYRAQVDLLVMSYHWGYESEYWPSRLQRECWAILREAGVDILYGHHSHIVQPFEVGPDDRGLCLYSCGNFAMNMPLEVYRQGAVFSVEIASDAEGRWYVQRADTHFTRRTGAWLDLVSPEESEIHRHWAGTLPAPDGHEKAPA